MEDKLKKILNNLLGEWGANPAFEEEQIDKAMKHIEQAYKKEGYHPGTLGDNKVKFVQYDGKEIVLDLKTGKTVTDLVATDQDTNAEAVKSANPTPKRNK